MRLKYVPYNTALAVLLEHMKPGFHSLALLELSDAQERSDVAEHEVRAAQRQSRITGEALKDAFDKYATELGMTSDDLASSCGPPARGGSRARPLFQASR